MTPRHLGRPTGAPIPPQRPAITKARPGDAGPASVSPHKTPTGIPIPPQRSPATAAWPGDAELTDATRRAPSADAAPVHVTARCAGCGACLLTCPTHAIRPLGGTLLVRADLCTGCLECVDVCPVDAIDTDGGGVSRIGTAGEAGDGLTPVNTSGGAP